MSEDINQEIIQKELQRPIGGALTALEWFLLFSFVDHAMTKDEMFVSREDRDSLALTVKRLHSQVFPAPKNEREELEDTLGLNRPKILTGKGLFL